MSFNSKSLRSTFRSTQFEDSAKTSPFPPWIPNRHFCSRQLKSTPVTALSPPGIPGSPHAFPPRISFPPAHIPFMSLTFVFTPQLPSGDSSPDRTLTCRTFCSHLQLNSLHIRAVINQLLYKPCYLCTCPLNTQEILLRSAAGSAGSLVVNVQFLDVYSRDLQPAALEPHVRRKCKLKSSCKGKSKVKEKSFNLNFLQVLHKQLQDSLNHSSRILKQQR